MIGRTNFDLEGQMRFAALSGDHNPIHVDPIAVRRTLPARMVVHGVHVLLWALGEIAGTFDATPPPIARIRVRFLRFTYVGDEVSVVATKRSDGEIQLCVIGGDVARAEIRITFGAAIASAVAMPRGESHPQGVGPVENSFDSIDERHGHVAFAAPAGALGSQFPAAARWIGSERIDALGAATRLVGMIYPGLHSVLGGVDMRTIPEDGAGELGFRMGELRHGQIDAVVSGGGIVGTLDCRVPNPPVVQPSSEALRGLVAPRSYAGAQVLVVGGSRGVGEACAKLLALGGADVRISYRDGAADAAAVAADIEAAGGRCAVQHYDARRPADRQLGELAPTHACWFATPVMTRPDMKLLDERRQSECRSVLVSAFFAFAMALHARRLDVRLLYPSTDWIDQPPPGLAEYVMAKAAGEVLARSMRAAVPRIDVLAPRLPAMATDQTARLAVGGAAAAETMLPHLDQLIRGGVTRYG